jgi:hypothetical protein
MDLLFRKRVRIDPLRVNLSKSAPSVSLVAGPARVFDTDAGRLEA